MPDYVTNVAPFTNFREPDKPAPLPELITHIIEGMKSKQDHEQSIKETLLDKMMESKDMPATVLQPLLRKYFPDISEFKTNAEQAAATKAQYNQGMLDYHNKTLDIMNRNADTREYVAKMNASQRAAIMKDPTLGPMTQRLGQLDMAIKNKTATPEDIAAYDALQSQWMQRVPALTKTTIPGTASFWDFGGTPKPKIQYQPNSNSIQNQTPTQNFTSKQQQFLKNGLANGWTQEAILKHPDFIAAGQPQNNQQTEGQ